MGLDEAEIEAAEGQQDEILEFLDVHGHRLLVEMRWRGGFVWRVWSVYLEVSVFLVGEEERLR